MLRSVEELSGYTLQAKDGEIGEVDQFYFDDESWTIRYLVVKTGNWLLGRKVLISPIALDQPDWETRRFPVQLTQNQVENSPDIVTDLPVSRQHEYELHQYYDWPTYWSHPGDFSFRHARLYTATSMEARESETTQPVTTETTEQDKYDPHLRSTKEVTGYHIKATDGEIGHVEDFIVDDQTWQIHYMVVNTRNWLSDNKKVLIAPQWIEKVSWIDRGVHVKFTQEAVKNSPEFIPSTPLDRDYEERLYDHYDMPKYWHKEGTMGITYLSQELNGKLIINITNGEIIAKVIDVLINPDTHRVAALVTSKGSLLKRKTEALPGDAVQVWGQDVILVAGADLISTPDDLSNSETWLSVSDQLKGHEVVSTDGTRLGELNDVVIDAEGRVISYALGRVFAEEHLAGLDQITVEATQSIGQDILIVDLARIE